MNTKKLYNAIYKAIDEALNIQGVEVDSFYNKSMGDIKPMTPPTDIKGKQQLEHLQSIYTKMMKDTRFVIFMNQNKMADEIMWSLDVDTACTDGHNGQFVANPYFLEKIYERYGDEAVQFIVLHETMHNYYNNQLHKQEIHTAYDNIIIDRQINNEIIRRWPFLKDIPQKIGALL